MARWTHDHETPGTGCPVCATFIYGLLIGFPALVAIIAVLITLLRD